LSNAVKFTHKDGKITIEYNNDNSEHNFKICDNGAGISEEDLKHLFEPFKQGESARENAAKGTGLGLAISKKIVTEIHNGKIHAESEINKGSCFYISL
jgi:signal transduction histidine kinase